MASALRLPRALVFATLCLVASGGGHALAGGGPVPPLLGALGGVIAFCLAYALNGRERGPGVVLPATAGTQALLHDLFTRAAPAPHPAPSPLHGHPGLGMTAVHLAVALLTGWWLQRGESALWLMIRLYGVRIPVVRLFVIAVTGLPGAAPRAVPASDVRPYDGWEASPVLRRRGPPAPARVG
ncbi:hypothetical protein AB0395_38285 [Streptosporangium sp. NPDC051023]|uniref:hypothetical protein n=1 Tax=Streptosporangium sp. NPDC051023 TaxID=3155410 RepID=UPI00344E0873